MLGPFLSVEVILYKALNLLGCGSMGFFFSVAKKAVKSSVNYIDDRGGKISLSLAVFCFEDFWRRIKF